MVSVANEVTSAIRRVTLRPASANTPINAAPTRGRKIVTSNQYDQVIIVPPVTIHPSATLERAVIGPDVTVAANCVVRDSIVKNSIIGEGSQIEDALLDESLIGKFAYVGGRYRVYYVGDSSSVDFSDTVQGT
jgi:NDP-sugar pyrophosphorylase family protein